MADNTKYYYDFLRMGAAIKAHVGEACANDKSIGKPISVIPVAAHGKLPSTNKPSVVHVDTAAIHGDPNFYYEIMNIALPTEISVHEFMKKYCLFGYILGCKTYKDFGSGSEKDVVEQIISEQPYDMDLSDIYDNPEGIEELMMTMYSRFNRSYDFVVESVFAADWFIFLHLKYLRNAVFDMTDSRVDVRMATIIKPMDISMNQIDSILDVKYDKDGDTEIVYVVINSDVPTNTAVFATILTAAESILAYRKYGTVEKLGSVVKTLSGDEACLLIDKLTKMIDDKTRAAIMKNGIEYHK